MKNWYAEITATLKNLKMHGWELPLQLNLTYLFSVFKRAIGLGRI